MDVLLVKKIAVLCSIIGIAILYLISSITNTTRISDITIKDVGAHMKICGEITQMRVSNNHIFFTIDDNTKEINSVIFNTTALHLNATGNNIYGFGVGDSLCIPGVVDEYPKNSGSIELIYGQGVIEKIV